MTNQQILEKAIQKAQKNGFMPDYKFDYSKDMGWTYVLKDKPKQFGDGLSVNVTGMLSEGDIIYSHDFAKALWGEQRNPKFLQHFIPASVYKPEELGYPDYGHIIDELWICSNCGEELKNTWRQACLLIDKGKFPGWEYGLKNMVVADDPIKYLGENIKDYNVSKNSYI